MEEKSKIQKKVKMQFDFGPVSTKKVELKSFDRGAANVQFFTCPTQTLSVTDAGFWIYLGKEIETIVISGFKHFLRCWWCRTSCYCNYFPGSLCICIEKRLQIRTKLHGKTKFPRTTDSHFQHCTRYNVPTADRIRNETSNSFNDFGWIQIKAVRFQNYKN